MELLEEGVHLLPPAHVLGRSWDVANQASELLRSSSLMRLLLPPQANHFFVMFYEHVVCHYGHPVRAQQKRPQLRRFSLAKCLAHDI